MPQPLQPVCVFEGDPALAADAARFVQTTVDHPDTMARTLGSVKVTSSGEILYGVPSERDVAADFPIVQCIGAAATVLRSGADTAFRYDLGTSQAAQATNMARARELGRASITETDEAKVTRDRITYLAIFAGRLANPGGSENYTLPRFAAPKRRIA